MSDQKSYTNEIEPGDFPFPLSKGQEESPYLTWLRNHSNYMAARGVVDWLRAIGVLLQGIVINSLIVLSLFLLLSLVIGHLYGNELRARNAADTDPVTEILPADELFKITVQRRKLESDSPIKSAEKLYVPEEYLTRVNVVAISQNTRWVVSGNEDGTARLWDTEHADDDPVELVGHKGPVVAVAFSPDGHWLATASDDKTARLWNLRSDNPAKEPLVLEGHSDWINAVAFSSDSNWLATASDDSTARLWKLQADNPAEDPLVLEGHSDWVYAVAFSPDGHWLATASDDETARLWNIASGDLGGNPVELMGYVSAVAFSPDGRWLAIASDDGRTRLCKLEARADPCRDEFFLEGHSDWINSVVFSPASNWLATTSNDNTTRLWNLGSDDPSENSVPLKAHEDLVTAVAFSSDGERIVTASIDGTLYQWDTRTGSKKAALQYEAGVLALAIDPDPKWLVTAGWGQPSRPTWLTRSMATSIHWLKSPTMPPQFDLTVNVLLLCLLFVLISPIVILFGDIFGQRKSMIRPGSDSSVASREKYEKAFGVALLLILAVFFFESLPALVHKFHELRMSNTNWNTLFTSATAVSMAVMGGAGKFLSVLGDTKKKLAMLLIGITGLLAPLIVVVYLTDYVVFGPPADATAWWWLWALPIFGTVAIFVAILFSLRGGISVMERLRLFGLPFVLFLALSFVVAKSAGVGAQWSTKYHEATRPQARKLVKLANGLAINRDDSVKQIESHEAIADLARRFLEIPDEDRFLWAPGFAADLDAALARANNAREYLGNTLIKSVKDTLDGHLATLEKLTGLEEFRASLNDLDERWAKYDKTNAQLKKFVEKAKTINPNSTSEDVKIVAQELSQIAWAFELAADPAALEIAKKQLSKSQDRQSGEANTQKLRTPSVVLQQRSRKSEDPQLELRIQMADELADDEIVLEDLHIQLMQLVDSAVSIVLPSVLAGSPDIYDVGYLADEYLDLSQTDRLGLDLTDELNLSSLAADLESGQNRKMFLAELETTAEELVNATTKLAKPDSASREHAILAFGPLADLASGIVTPYNKYAHLAQKTKALFLFILAIELWLFCRLTVDINRTSIHGLYRDRLASSYLVGIDTKGDIGIEEDVNLGEICCHEAGSMAPYHLINVALNLQGSKDISIRDRNSDFFILSKRFIGGQRTGYCRSATIEKVHPQMDLAAAMAISAAAASPNMGRSTNPALVAFMVLLNIRLGYWLPNPGLLEEMLAGNRLRAIKKKRKLTRTPPGFSFEQVFEQELVEVQRRWARAYPNAADEQRKPGTDADGPITTPTTKHGLVGLGLSGGGIRSATINLGIVQVLHEYGVFDHVDYMSTVSGGGYLGSSISTLMRERTKTLSEISGKLSVKADDRTNEKVVCVARKKPEQREYPFASNTLLTVVDGDRVRAGQQLSMGPRAAIYSEIAGVVKIKKNEANNTTRTVVVLDDERLYRYSDYTTIDETAVLTAKVKTGQPLIRHSGRLTRTEIGGKVSTEINEDTDEKIVKITAQHERRFAFLAARLNKKTYDASDTDESRKYTFSKYDALRVKDGDTVRKGASLIRRHNSLLDRFRWRVRPAALVREMSMRLDEDHKWVNLSDGGHIENLGGMELLRRRCKYVILGDGEADPELAFNGLATLIRYARIDLGIQIDINPRDLRKITHKNAIDEGKDGLSTDHFASGRITYPPIKGSKTEETGYLLYLKSSCTGDEDEVIQEYRQRKPEFPHESTADQFFDEDQFECYRALGQHIAEKTLALSGGKDEPDGSASGKMSYAKLTEWFESIEERRKNDFNG